MKAISTILLAIFATTAYAQTEITSIPLEMDTTDGDTKIPIRACSYSIF